MGDRGRDNVNYRIKRKPNFSAAENGFNSKTHRERPYSRLPSIFVFTFSTVKMKLEREILGSVPQKCCMTKIFRRYIKKYFEVGL